MKTGGLILFYIEKSSSAAIPGASSDTLASVDGSNFGFRALIVVVVGGLGSIGGAFLAGIFLGLLETLVSLFIGPSLRTLVVFATFIVILVIRQNIILRTVASAALVMP